MRVTCQKFIRGGCSSSLPISCNIWGCNSSWSSALSTFHSSNYLIICFATPVKPFCLLHCLSGSYCLSQGIFFSPFLPVCEKQCRETKWTFSVNFPALARLHAWRHMLIRHMPDRSHLIPHALLSPADCFLSAPSVILSFLSFSGLHVPVTSQRIILIRSIWRQTGRKQIWKSRKLNTERTAEMVTPDSQFWVSMAKNKLSEVWRGSLEGRTLRIHQKDNQFLFAVYPIKENCFPCIYRVKSNKVFRSSLLWIET